MIFSSYQLISENSTSLNTGSYLTQTEHLMFVNENKPDIWYGVSERDAIELGVWSRNKKLLNWSTIYQNKEYVPVTLSYTDPLNFPVTYSYNELNSEFVFYRHEKILVNPIEQLSSSFNILSGSYFLTYNFIREMAGNENSPLVIKDISPSRKEIKLIPMGNSTLAYDAYCHKKVLISDISPLYINSIKNCPYDEIYSQLLENFPEEINTIRNVFFLTSEDSIIQFFKNLYEDQWIYNSSLESAIDFNLKSDIIRLQGIKTYFINFLLQNSSKIIGFEELDDYFKGYVSASIERKFSMLGANPIQPYINAKTAVYDFFVKYFYSPISKKLAKEYNNKYYFPFKNALNFGNNRLLPIINNGFIDERESPEDPLTLIIKLQSELPIDINIQSNCWVSNISLSPYIVSAILKFSDFEDTYKIGAPNFSIQIPDISLTNTNLKYTEDDLREEHLISRELVVSKNIQDLSIDYTDFKNFVVFSSAEMRLKIFKNKMINISRLNSAIEILNIKNNEFIVSSGSNYPYYEHEYKSIQNQLDEFINTFDGYESYLYDKGFFKYENKSFISASYIKDLESEAVHYDKLNRDSFINNCPEYILSDSENDEYIVFLTMIGHFFDNIYIYISNLPSEKKVGNNESEEFTRRIADYILQAFGWNIDDTLEQSNVLNNYLSSNELKELNRLSAEERLKIIRNRLLVNLPQIYKTKGTEEAIKIILSCYGIPSSLLSVREYGGINYLSENASYTTYERVYLRQWSTASQYDTYYLSNPPGMRTCLFKFSMDNAKLYTKNNEYILMGGFDNSNIENTDELATGKWSVGFIRTYKPNSGKLFFRIGTKNSPIFKIYSPEFPMFNGSIYSVMLRRNMPDDGFEYTENDLSVPSKFDLYVQQNDSGNKILHLTSSGICYDTASNHWFSGEGNIRIGGWFTYWNRGGYDGCFDKLQTWFSALTDQDFENYVNNINSYVFSGADPHKNLIFRMHYDYPVNQRQQLVNGEWTGIWKNGNPYFSDGSEDRLEKLYGIHGINVDYMINSGSWAGAQELIPDKCSPTGFVSQSCYPWQFKVIDYPSTWNVSKYGPNKFRNEKINYVSQSVEARFDHLNRSTNTLNYNIAPDSNQIGIFVDPQDFKNRDIVRYLGNCDLMDSIGDPANQFESEYSSLKLLRKQYSDLYMPSSGSKTLFNELLTLYKLYFNKSIFEAIKNVIPARAKPLIGVLIEPSILERPKYQLKKMDSEINISSSLFLETPTSTYYGSKEKLVNISAFNAEMEHSTSIVASHVALPLRDFPANFGGNYIRDFTDPYTMGHFAGGILSQEELESLILLPYVSFIGNPRSGYAPLDVQFNSQYLNAQEFKWVFGDEDKYISVPRLFPIDPNLKHSTNPRYIYEFAGTYNVSLTAYNGTILSGFHNTATKNAYIRVNEPEIIPSFELYDKKDMVVITEAIADKTEVKFKNFSVVNANPNFPVVYKWEFGNGETKTVEVIPGGPVDEDEYSPVYVYPEKGTYTAKLTITSGRYSKSTTKNINVLMADVDCGGLLQVSGGVRTWGNPYEKIIDLGTDTGEVWMRYDSYNIPDRFILEWDGEEKIDTGWVGDYGNSINATKYIDALKDHDPSLTISGIGQGTISFNKNKREPIVAKLIVHCPLFTTGWRVKIGCPGKGVPSEFV